MKELIDRTIEIHSDEVLDQLAQRFSSKLLIKTLKDVSFKNSVLDFKWQFEVNPISGGHLVCVSFERPDTETGRVSRGRGRFEFIGHDATVSGIVKTAWLLIELVVRHELMEGFRWKGNRIFNPHHTVEELASIEDKHATDWTI